MKQYRWFLMIAVLCYITIFSPVSAQPPSIITITAPEYLSDIFEDMIIPAFEAENPDIQVEFVLTEHHYGSALIDIENGRYFDDVAAYASSADVLYVADYNLSSYATYGGFFLDLSPLVNADSSLMPEDFYPGAWQAFQWDGGIWALPYRINVEVLVYNQDMFDAAGVPYPDESWRLADFIQAAEAFHIYNSDGEVEFSPLFTLNPLLLIYAEVGEDAIDTSVIPSVPDYSNPRLIAALEMWNQYWRAYDFAEFRSYSLDQTPMSISYPYQLLNQANSDTNTNWRVALLPGGIAGLRAEGFAISRGTAYPEAAYRLASFLTRNQDLLRYSIIPGSRSARRSLAYESTENFFSGDMAFEPEVQAVLDQALENAVPPSQLRFMDVVYSLNSGGADVLMMLDEYKQRVIAALEEAEAQQGRQLIVQMPEIRTTLSPGQVILKFGMNNGFMDEQDNWRDVVDEFVMTHPNIVDIDFDDSIYSGGGSIAEQLDCYYESRALVGLAVPPSGILALNPLMDADPDFSPEHFLPGVLEQVQFDGMNYAYPLTVQPVMMWINEAKFEEAGLPIPDVDWTVNDFTNTLITLGNLRSDPEQPVVYDEAYGVNSLLMLFAAYGGVPIDYQTDPPTYNLTTPQNLEAMRQVINYIREQNLITYNGLLEFQNSTVSYSPPHERYIVIDVLSNFSPYLGNRNPEMRLRPVPFPTGDLIPVSYLVGSAMISNESLNIEGCYEWIKTMARHPERFAGMPVDTRQLDNPALEATQGADMVTFYRQLVNVWNQPNVIVLPGPNGFVPSSTLGAWLEPYFFYAALDHVILDGTDLETEMAQAEENIAAYRDCIRGIDELSAGELEALSQADEQSMIDYLRQYVDCAVNILPDLREQFSFFYQ